MKTNKLSTSAGLALTLILTTSVFNAPANAGMKGKYIKVDGSITYICPQFSSYKQQLEAIAKSENPGSPLCVEPSGTPTASLLSKKPTTLIPLLTASQSLDSFKVSNQQEVKQTCNRWFWIAGRGWTYIPC